MARESRLQTKVAQYLRGKGCFVMVIQPTAGIPTGTADIFFCKGPLYGWLELKAAHNSPFQPLQKEFIAKMDSWSWAKACWPDLWDEIRQELDEIL